jgi:hypothetical protein
LNKETTAVSLKGIEDALGSRGLRPRGAFHPDAADVVPTLPDGRPAATLVLAGQAGPEMWRRFSAAPPDGRDPLDDWSRRELGAIAQATGASALFPGDGPPYLPFQRWARRADTVFVSPIGVLIHPDYGLWHSYRGALAFAERLDLPAPEPRPNPCEACAAKPCLTTCPVDALKHEGYDVPACIAHLERPEGSDCLGLGCRARRACPIGRDYVYEPAQAEFHMAAFLKVCRAG